MKNKYGIIYVVGVIFFATMASGEEVVSCLSETFPEFSAISRKSVREINKPFSVDHGIFISLKEAGPRFNYKVGHGNRTISQYGDEVFVPFGSEAEFRSKSYSIFIRPVTNQNAFLVEKRYDLRSLGGEVESEYILLDVSTNRITASKTSIALPQGQ